MTAQTTATTELGTTIVKSLRYATTAFPYDPVMDTMLKIEFITGQVTTLHQCAENFPREIARSLMVIKTKKEKNFKRDDQWSRVSRLTWFLINNEIMNLDQLILRISVILNPKSGA